MRDLATPNFERIEVENDSFQAMQQSTMLLTANGTTVSPTSFSGESVLPEDRIIDLQRIVQQHEVQCNAARQEEFIVSVYTCLLDHQDRKTCHEPKIAILGGDPSEWYDDILQPWRHHVTKEEEIFLDIVQPHTPRADVEEHIAHILLTKRSTALSSTLLSLEFVDPLQRSVVVRYATVLPRHSTVQDLSAANPFFANLPTSRLVWIHPEMKEEDHAFRTRSGMGIIIKVLPEQVPSPTQSDHTYEPFQPLTDVTNLMQTKEGIGKPQIKTSFSGPDDIQPLCSFTDEFLEAVAAHRDAEQMEPPMHLIPDPRSIDAQPESIRDLWERFTDAQAVSPIESGNVQRVESWFLNHRSFTRCHQPRITLLYEDFLAWHQALIHTWHDKLEGQEDISFAVVHPLPEDAASGIIAQVIVTQHAMPEFRSSALSVYDTDPDIERSPHTFALVLPQQLTLESLSRFLNLLPDCTPPDRRNHCTLWFGRIPIASHTILNVHMGHAFRLLVSRGEPVAISQLLAMSSSQLREVLQRSRQPEIFVRPPNPSFLPMPQEEIERLPSHLELPVDQRLVWIMSLESRYDRHHVVEDMEVGPVLPVQVWYLNMHPEFHCSQPHRVILSSDTLMWRTEIIFPWRDRILRGTMTDIHVLPYLMTDPQNAQQTVQALVTQGLAANTCAALLTLHGNIDLHLRQRRFGHVFLSRVAVPEILRLAVPEEHSHRPALVQFNGHTYLPGEYVLLQPGSHIGVMISEQNVDLFTDQIADGFSLHQTNAVIHQAVVSCKPAPFDEPDDLAMSLPSSNPPPRPRPHHDGCRGVEFSVGRDFAYAWRSRPLGWISFYGSNNLVHSPSAETGLPSV